MSDYGHDVLRLMEVSQRIERDKREQRALLTRLLAAGYGVREVARITGYSPAHISRIRTGKYVNA